jgi:metallo-beta-lactamase family protein
VPAFAVGRTQEFVATLHELIGAGRLPDVPLFVDSPMAREATGVFRATPSASTPRRAKCSRGRGRAVRLQRLRYVGRRTNRARSTSCDACIIISASGMCEGGRVLHHLQHALGNERNTVLFVGFQGDGTLGRRLLEGAETVNVFGEPVRVRAEITSLDGFSAHADQRELLDWVGKLKPAPKTIFLVHGELKPAETLAALLRERVGATVHIPEKGQEFDLWT